MRNQTSQTTIRQWALAAAMLLLGAACAGRQPAGTTTTANEPAPVDLDGSLLNDPSIVALMPPPCAPPNAAGECSDGCQWVANVCRRVQGGIGQPERRGDGGTGRGSGQPEKP